MALYHRNTVMALAIAAIALSFGVRPSWAADVKGKIAVTGSYPENQTIAIVRKPHKRFPDTIESRTLLVSEEGFLQNAVVTLQGDLPAGGNRSDEQVYVLDQKEHRFEPHVVVMPLAATLRILNSDPMVHDVRAFDENAKILFRLDMPDGGKPEDVTFPAPGVYVVRCGIHKWMHAYVLVMPDTRYAVSDASGEFLLSGVPHGKYNLTIWHETLGARKIPLQVEGSIDDFLYTYDVSTPTQPKGV
ncbi:MAG: hypothetical protein Q8R76_06980 [Candidatus Omnitrophota bacterium]|nr:hypothetical protein [Candidatus Omnitrophota bacterium]